MEDEQLRSQVLQNMVRETEDVKTNRDNQQRPCAICLADVSELATTKPCAHEFDFVCIVNWLERSPTCPLCKAKVQTVEYDQTSRQDIKIYTVQHLATVLPNEGGLSSVPNRDRRHQLQRGPQRRQHQSRNWHASRTRTTVEDPLSRRKHVYRHQSYSMHIGSNRVSRFQELTPKRFRDDIELVSRARKWIRRELQVFEYLAKPCEGTAWSESHTRRVRNPEYLLEWIIAMLKSVDIKGSSGQAEDMLQEFLGRNDARLFLHELRAWLRSPYNHLQDWDRHVQYNETLEPQSDGCSSTAKDVRQRIVSWVVDQPTP